MVCYLPNYTKGLGCIPTGKLGGGIRGESSCIFSSVYQEWELRGRPRFMLNKTGLRLRKSPGHPVVKCLPWINRLRLSEFSNGNHVEGNHVEDWETANPETSRLLEGCYYHHLPRHSLLKLLGCVAVSITIPWPVTQKEAGTPGEVWGCCSSNWYQRPERPLLLLNGRQLSNNYLSPSAFGWPSFPADWPWRDVQGMAWDLEVDCCFH